MNHSPLTAVLLAVAMTSAVAATPPPHGPVFDAMTWPATLKQASTKGVTLGELRVQFEETTLSQVERAASIGTVAHHGDAAESTYWICYTISGPGEAERIWIISNGEMGGREGGEHAVTGIAVVRLKHKQPRADCPLLPGNLQPVALDDRIWLGASSAEVKSAFGVPSHVAGAWWEFDYQSKVPGNCDGGYDLLNSLTIKLDEGHVNTIFADQVTSC
jgi:hypothetical protein